MRLRVPLVHVSNMQYAHATLNRMPRIDALDMHLDKDASWRRTMRATIAIDERPLTEAQPDVFLVTDMRFVLEAPDLNGGLQDPHGPCQLLECAEAGSSCLGRIACLTEPGIVHQTVAVRFGAASCFRRATV